ncbi:MlaA family lipoprotein [Acinetobacter sp. WZC-1]|uniref:MlaA family lipoprotein n=1 Tax=Acinetobacter sp. WZC-1 TaxID=3459034 RepID=UPI00403D8E28
MHRFTLLWASMLIPVFTSQVFAQDLSTAETSSEAQTTIQPIGENDSQQSARHPRLKALTDLKNIKVNDLKVNANAAQSDSIKDPLQPLNREIYVFNDKLDQYVARPLAVQYVKKVPTEVRGSYRSFKKNLMEPWNAVNQVIQGRFSRAAKTLGRFTVNTVTSLGLADPAGRLGMTPEEENFGTTLGYYGVPSGPYLMLPILGPSTFRDGFGLLVDSQARPQKYILDDQNGLYWSEQLWRGVDARAQLLDVEDVLQGDRYSAIRDIYLQRKNFQIAEKKGKGAEAISFVDDDEDDSTEGTPTGSGQ